jgi:hypothetical protein
MIAMMKIFKPIHYFVCILFFSLMSLSYAQSSQIGNLLFETPAGWQQTEQGDFTLLTPPDATQDRLLAILFTEGTDITGDAKATFERLVADALDVSETLEQESELEESRNANGLAVFTKVLVVTDSESVQTTRVYLGYDAGSRLEVIVVAANDASLFEVYSEELTAFQNSLTLATAPAGSPPQSPLATEPQNPLTSQLSQRAATLPPTNVKLQGLYYGSELRNQLNFATNLYEYRVINYYYLFSPDGFAYQGLPPAEWLEQFDADEIAATDPSNLGYYSVTGREITFSFPDSEPYSRTFEQTGERLFLGTVQLDPVKPLPSGFTLDGTYYYQSFTNISTPGGVDAGGIEGSVSGQRMIIFYPNGRFDSSSFVGSASTGTAANATTSETRSGSGTYSFQTYRLILSYDDGTQQGVSFFVNPQEGVSSTPGLVFIDGVGWLRQE